jgi:superfamily II DNA/RNA helicase
MIAIKNEIDNLNLVKKDPKAAKLLESIRQILTEKSSEQTKRKVIIFSEYVDTVRYLRPLFEEVFPDTVLTVEGNITTSLHKQILTNFDASVPNSKQEDAFQILLTSDTLSEGFNLNRAGLIINYDIPWNPTRVIQRVGRINRIGKKVFDKLMIYNFFPTIQGSDIIKSRQIASQKMFLIHSTLGEDAKIFESDELPSASEMYTRINQNPEKDGDESLITTIRKKYTEYEKKFPEAIKRLESLPSRIKTAKSYTNSQLTVFQRKGLGLFVQHISDPNEQKPQPIVLLLQESLPLIECPYDEPRLDLSPNFWPCYEIIKEHKTSIRVSKSEISLEIKALNNLQTALRLNDERLLPYLPFIKILIKDLRDYRALPKYTLRRISAVAIDPKKSSSIEDLIKELSYLRSHLGDDYINIVEDRVSSIKKEIIIAIENIGT